MRFALLGRIVAGLTVASLLAACGDAGELAQRTESDTVLLRAAAERTLAADSFRMTSDAGELGSVVGVVNFDYQAPDRVRTASDGDIFIEIGRTAYSTSHAPDDGLFAKHVEPDRQRTVIENLLMPLKSLARADAVTRSGVMLQTTIRGARYEARITDGFVTRVRIEIDAEVEGKTWTDDFNYRFSDFNADIKIEAPPDIDLQREGARAPECGPDGKPPAGRTVCKDLPPQLPPEVELPPPSGPATSTLQLRLVLGEGDGGCSPPGVNPRPEAPAQVPTSDGSCLRLGPAEIDARQVSYCTARQSAGEGVDLDVVLFYDHVLDLRRIEKQQAGEQMAVVMFGEVLLTRELKRGSFDDLVIRDIPLDLASRINAALG